MTSKICHEKSWPDELSENSDTEGSSVNPLDTESNCDDHTSANCPSRWYEKPVYDRYWKHYRYMQDWFNRHHTVVHRLDCLSISGNHGKWNPYMYSVMLSQWSKYYYDMYLRQCETFLGKNRDSDDHNNDNEPRRTQSKIPQRCSSEGVFKKPHPVTKHKSRKRKDSHRQSSEKRRKRHSVSSCKSSTSKPNESSGSQDLFEMEITGEMLDFFVKSAQHKKEMAALKKKKKEEEKETGDYVPLAAAPSGGRRTTQAPAERPGVRRTAEMKLLYGDGAAMIHGMETAVQLTYDRHFDILQPKFWPNLPLNIKF